MYTQDINSTVRSDKEALCWLLTVADRFETPDCMRKCVEHLTSAPLTLDDVIMYLNLSEMVKRRRVTRPLIDSISELTGWSFEEVADPESFHTLGNDSMARLVSALRDRDEYAEQLFGLCLERFRYRPSDRWESFANLLWSLDFWRMRPSFVVNEVETCPELCTPEGRALIAKVRMYDPPEDPGAADHGAPAGNRRLKATKTARWLFVWGMALGYAVPLLIACTMIIKHGFSRRHNRENLLILRTMTQAIPLASAGLLLSIGKICFCVQLRA